MSLLRVPTYGGSRGSSLHSQPGPRRANPSGGKGGKTGGRSGPSIRPLLAHVPDEIGTTALYATRDHVQKMAVVAQRRAGDSTMKGNAANKVMGPSPKPDQKSSSASVISSVTSSPRTRRTTRRNFLVKGRGAREAREDGDHGGRSLWRSRRTTFNNTPVEDYAEAQHRMNALAARLSASLSSFAATPNAA